jgi:hypothetical protein
MDQCVRPQAFLIFQDFSPGFPNTSYPGALAVTEKIVQQFSGRASI